MQKVQVKISKVKGIHIVSEKKDGDSHHGIGL